ncbi:hypothetical protein NHX12_003434 [Muraenolepis orangiensis]|uniref:Uncharacterized protein n=1 Tax=Muraenolepis orangiensis TaxID=630683 RepID=A0A9Q0DWI7_9TELE|nr:hypothetical protein NHX12_003434 [Muraenolepis orangiensis]
MADGTRGVGGSPGGGADGVSWGPLQNHCRTTAEPLQNHYGNHCRTTAEPLWEPLQNHYGNHYRTTMGTTAEPLGTTAEPLGTTAEPLGTTAEVLQNSANAALSVILCHPLCAGGVVPKQRTTGDEVIQQ